MAQLTFQRARTEEKKRQRAEALVEAARSLALETGVASVTLTAVARRAGIHYSAVRRYFTSHKEVLLHLSAEGWVRWSNTVSDKLAQPGAATPSRIAETLADALADDPLFCDLLANLHLHLEHEVDAERVVEVKRISTAATLSSPTPSSGRCPNSGARGRWTSCWPPTRWRPRCGRWPTPERLTDAYAEEPEVVPPEWNLDFASALTRLLTATCIGLIPQSA